MSTIASTSSSVSPIPKAFLCTSSHQRMRDPHLALCSHLFDLSVVKKGFNCPLDQQPVSIWNCIPFDELKQKIAREYPEIVPKKAPSPEAIPPAVSDDNDFQVVSKSKPSKPKVSTIRPVKIIQNAHEDDIHGFIQINPQAFVSGSKDGTLKIWSNQGTTSQTLMSDVFNKGYEYWVTALTPFKNDTWASGTRDGYISIWNNGGKELKQFTYAPSNSSKAGYVCKDRNKTRVHCITEVNSSKNSTLFYTGTAKFIQLWNAKGKLIKYYQAAENDWVYCIELLQNRDLLVVVGGDLEFWKMGNNNPPAKETLIKEGDDTKHGKQRALISAITKMTHNPDVWGCAVFDGSVQLYDLNKKKTVQHFKEHRGRVWSVRNLRPFIFASSADDKTIKIWDVRQKSSTLTIGNNPGRVSSLLCISENEMISGSCPDKVFESKEKASIRFWDIRGCM